MVVFVCVCFVKKGLAKIEFQVVGLDYVVTGLVTSLIELIWWEGVRETILPGVVSDGQERRFI